MSLTKQQRDNLLIATHLPHYYRVNRGPEWQRCCGTIKDVECLLNIYPDATVTQVFPPMPRTIDVPHIIVKDQELPMQQILPQSDLQELKL